MIVGFTGTRDGLKPKQRDTLAALLLGYGRTESHDGRMHQFHHGDCLGADFEAHVLARLTKKFYIVGHPPDNPKSRAWCVCDTLKPTFEYKVRNKNIVRVADLLVACPKQDYEEVRSGTWQTIRYARSTKKPVVFVWPSGALQVEEH